MGTLVADIGGTRTRCAIAGPGRRLRHLARFMNRDYAGLDGVLLAYLDGLPPADRPDRAVLAIAAPFQGDAVEMTNIGWSFSLDRIRDGLGLSHLVGLNDFEALAHALPAFDDDDLARIGGADPMPSAPRVVLGPGTGLGVAGLVTVGDRSVVIASEGGHASMSACNHEEARLIEAAWSRYGHGSAERLISGPALPFIHATLHGGEDRSAADLGDAMLAGDPASTRTYGMFFRMLASFASNLALTFGAFGGVYIGGGIVPRYLPQLQAAGFRERFEDKGRYRDYLGRIPVFVITAKQPTLIGLATYAESSSGST